MIPFALLLLSTNLLDIAEQTVKVPAAEWRSRRVMLRKPATLDMEYQMLAGGRAIRLVLIPSQEEERFRAGRPFTHIITTAFEREGRLRIHIATPGEYSLIVDNQLEQHVAAQVRLQGRLAFDNLPSDVRTLSWPRRLVIIGCSLSVFGGICWIAGRRLWMATRGRRIPAPPPPFA